jgi:hypothetical protein
MRRPVAPVTKANLSQSRFIHKLFRLYDAHQILPSPCCMGPLPCRFLLGSASLADWHPFRRIEAGGVPAGLHD